MGRKLDPLRKVARGPGRKAKKQQGAETELKKILVEGEFCKHKEDNLLRKQKNVSGDKYKPQIKIH